MYCSVFLPKEIDAYAEDLTRTSKVSRGFIAEKYAVLTYALYTGKARQYIETQVKFEDGRQGKVSADLEIKNVKTFSANRQAA